MSRRDGDGDDALIVILDPKGQTEERVNVSDFGPHQPVVCTCLPPSGAQENAIRF